MNRRYNTRSEGIPKETVLIWSFVSEHWWHCKEREWLKNTLVTQFHFFTPNAADFLPPSVQSRAQKDSDLRTGLFVNQRVLFWLENDGSSFKTSCLSVFVRSQYAISPCYECLSKTDYESSIDLCLRLGKAAWIEFLFLRLKCLGLIICDSFYKAIFTKAVKRPEFGFTNNIWIPFTFLFSLFFPLSISLQRTESACSEHHQQTGLHYRSEPWLRSGQHPPCRLETALCECQWSNKRGRDSQQSCSVVCEKIRTFLV